MTTRFRTGLVTSLIMAAVLILSGVTFAAPTAQAQSPLVCFGTETVTYEPGVTVRTQRSLTKVDGVLASCNAVAGITGGSYAESFPATLSCDTLLVSRTGTRVLHWKNGESSTFRFTREINNTGGQTTVTFLGTIASGQFTGAKAVQQVVFATPDLTRCLFSPGLQRLGPGPSILTIG